MNKIFFLLLFAASAVAQEKKPTTFTIHLNDTVQQIRNIGASACWYGEEIGKQWPMAARQKMAELLFSKKVDKSGKPMGIGLSAFRYNIGAGTAEQGDSSGIKDPSHRVECFLSPDGKYDWSKQEGYTWLLQQAKNYGVENLIAFVNSPPVQFTKNGLGFKLDKDYTTNLAEDKVDAFANFLAEVMEHFDKSNLHFNYVSPINEPQWDWSGVKGQAKQEGTPYTNEEIYKTIKAVNTALNNKNTATKILVTEAATLDHLTGSTGKAARQLASFYDPASPLYMGGLNRIPPYVEGHGYFTENGDKNLVGARARVRDSLKRYGQNLEYWQSEYCLLGDGFKEGTSTNKRSTMECALFLAKVIHHDFTIGNATAWHYWNSFEPGASDSNTRYNLVALIPKRMSDPTNLYAVTKNLWALGHYSLFVRPGMYRVETGRDDGMDDLGAAQDVMVSAYKDGREKQLVVNVINYTADERPVRIYLENLSGKNTMMITHHYVTSSKAGDDIKPYSLPAKQKASRSADIVVAPKSINTFIFSL